MTGLLALSLIVATPLPQQQSMQDWHRVASDADRTRLRAWRNRWKTALALIAADRIAQDPVLFDPDRGLDAALPAAGAYRCRFHRLPRRQGVPLVSTGWQPCSITAGVDGSRLATAAPGERLAGRLYPSTAARMVFLGSSAIGEERGPLPYGRDRLRDTAGLLERFAPARWRLVLPDRALGGPLDIMELVPA